MTLSLSQLGVLFAALLAVAVACRYLAAHGASGSIGPLVLGVLSLGSLCLAGRSLWNSYRLVRGAISAQGEVVRVEVARYSSVRSDRNYGDSAETSTVSKPVVRFRPRDAARDIEFTALGNTDKPTDYAVGDRVNVLYLPEQPEQAQLNIFGDLWLQGIILTIVGLVLGIAAWGMWFVAGKISVARAG